MQEKAWIPYHTHVQSSSYPHLSLVSSERSQSVAGVERKLMSTRLQWKITACYKFDKDTSSELQYY